MSIILIGGKGWLNVKGEYVDCLATSKNVDKYNDSKDAVQHWNEYKEKMQ